MCKLLEPVIEQCSIHCGFHYGKEADDALPSGVGGIGRCRAIASTATGLRRVCRGGAEGGCGWTEHSPTPDSDRITCASFLAPPNLSLTTSFSVGVEWEEAEVCVCKREEGRRPRTAQCAEISKHFSSTAMTGAGILTYQGEKMNEHSFSSETPLTRRGGLLVAHTGWGSIAQRNVATKALQLKLQFTF